MIKDKTVAAVVVAAGRSSRMGFDKLMYTIGGVPVLKMAVDALLCHDMVDEVVIAAGDNISEVRAMFKYTPAKKPLTIVPGGTCRAESVANGVNACKNADIVAIHDGARPFVKEELISRVLLTAHEIGAAAPATPAKDTVKKLNGDMVLETLQRSELVLMQTPQAFNTKKYITALNKIPQTEWHTLSDDCMVMEMANLPVKLVDGDEDNIKITTPHDLPKEAGNINSHPQMRVGHGYDVHRLISGRKLILGGVDIQWERGLLGHSDADVLTHAVMDALLGAAALGDIGQHFPDTDDAYRGISSMLLLQKVGDILNKNGYSVCNIDATIVCQQPKLAPYITAMREGIANELGLKPDTVSVKATTEEHLGFTGEGHGIAVHCVAAISGT